MTEYAAGELDEVLRKELGEAIKNLREALALTQQELADEIFVSRASVAQLETGRANPSSDRLAKIAIALVSHSERMSDSRIHPSTILALHVLRAGLTGRGQSDDEEAGGRALLAVDQTNQVIARTAAATVKGEFEAAPILAPLIGLLLLFPNVETSLLLHLLEKDDETAAKSFFHRQALDALYVADGILESLTGEYCIAALVREEVAQNPRLTAALREDLRGVAADDEGQPNLLAAFLNRALGATP